MKDLDQLLEYLYALDGRGIKLGLERARHLLRFLHNPQENLRIIHVAGTNGKGSTCSLVSSLLEAIGYRTGLFTSPHLVRFNERIRVNDRCISDEEIVNFILKVKPEVDKIDATFFETTTGMALDYFNRLRVDYAILETGLGGRLDATNIVNPLVTVITSISKDHLEKLGRRLREITLEKAGIIKEGVPVVVAKQRKEVREILRSVSERKEAPFFYVPDLVTSRIVSLYPGRLELQLNLKGSQSFRVSTPLSGIYQQENIATALATLSVMPGINFKESSVIKGFERVRWFGRMQLLKEKPLVIYDVGHNPDGLKKTFNTLRLYQPPAPVNLLIALQKNKDARRIAHLSQGLFDNVILSEIRSRNSMNVLRLARGFAGYYPESNLLIQEDFRQALELALTKTGKEGTLLIAGSHYFAEIVYDRLDFSLDSYLKFH